MILNKGTCTSLARRTSELKFKNVGYDGGKKTEALIKFKFKFKFIRDLQRHTK